VISIFVPIRNAAESARQCLNSLSASCQSLGAQDSVEYIVLDDGSDAQYEIPQLMREFRGAVSSKTTLLRFPTRRNYTSACAYGFSAARGTHVILISHDMLVTPHFIATMLSIAASDAQIGTVRGRSGHMDCSPNGLPPPTTIRTYADVIEFSAKVASQYGIAVMDNPALVGDSLLIQRSVLDKIGVMDERFVGFLGDFDYGIRARRAGFRTVESLGAWLHHAGCGTINAELTSGREKPEQVDQGLPMLDVAYNMMREKWSGISLPPTFAELRTHHLEQMLTCPPPQGGEFCAPPSIESHAVQIL
jgi:GT2 family glycosyltransferase